MEIDDLRINKLRAYLMDVLSEIVDSYKQLNIDFLSKDAGNFSVDKMPVPRVVSEWIVGVNLCQDTYSFRSRMNYSVDVINNIKNIGFFETFEKKIQDRNKNGILPEIDGIESIECLNPGTMNNANTNTAELDIQIRITYREVD
jgi:hypothetical protein